MEIKGKITCVFGLPNTGKTNFIRWLLQRPPYRRHLVFDPVKDYPTDGYGLVYRPQSRYHSDDGGRVNQELDMVVEKMFNEAPKAIRPKIMVIDEANRPLPNRKSIPPNVADLIDFNTHYDPRVGIIFACRRPTKLNSDVTEIANNYFILSQGGKNDRRGYNEIASGLADVLDDKNPYEIAHVNSNREISMYNPVKNMGEKGRI